MQKHSLDPAIKWPNKSILIHIWPYYSLGLFFSDFSTIFQIWSRFPLCVKVVWEEISSSRIDDKITKAKWMRASLQVIRERNFLPSDELFRVCFSQALVDLWFLSRLTGLALIHSFRSEGLLLLHLDYRRSRVQKKASDSYGKQGKKIVKSVPTFLPRHWPGC